MASGVVRDPALVLAIHSTSDIVGAALLSGDRVLASRQLEGGRAAIRLAGALAELVGEAGRELGHLGRLAVSLGPGSFTGIKVGLATAWGLSRTLGTGIVGVGALEVLAAQGDPGRSIGALLPAGRGEVYAALYGPAAAQRVRPVLRAPVLATAAEAAEMLVDTETLHLGCAHLLSALSLRRVCEADPGRLAADLGRLASEREPLAAGLVPDPLYLRRTWAEEVREKRLSLPQ